MPNHVINTLTITGPQNELDKLVAKMRGKESAFDFEKVISMPQEFLGIHTGSTHINGKQADMWREKTVKGETVHVAINPKDRLSWHKKYGADNWYDWAVKYWGTKWNAYEVSSDTGGKGVVGYVFWTAWASPHPIIEALSKLFPDLRFRVDVTGEVDEIYTYRYEGGESVL